MAFGLSFLRKRKFAMDLIWTCAVTESSVVHYGSNKWNTAFGVWRIYREQEGIGILLSAILMVSHLTRGFFRHLVY